MDCWPIPVGLNLVLARSAPAWPWTPASRELKQRDQAPLPAGVAVNIALRHLYRLVPGQQLHVSPPAAPRWPPPVTITSIYQASKKRGSRTTEAVPCARDNRRSWQRPQNRALPHVSKTREISPRQTPVHNPHHRGAHTCACERLARGDPERLFWRTFMLDDIDPKANNPALEIGAEEKTYPIVAEDDFTAEALAALTALGKHGEHQIEFMLQLGGAVAKAKSQLKHGDFTRWCEDTLKRKATWCSAHRRLFEIQEDIEPARAWAKEAKHRWADCFSVERLLKLVAESKKAKRTENATGDIPPAPKARRKLSDVVAELAQAQKRIAQDDADFVSLRDELSPEDDARARELAPLAAANDVAATEELAELGRRYHWRLRDLVGRETCGAPQVSRPTRSRRRQ